MPKKVHDLAMKLIRQGKSESSAWAIAQAQFGKKKKKKKRRVPKFKRKK